MAALLLSASVAFAEDTQTTVIAPVSAKELRLKNTEDLKGRMKGLNASSTLERTRVVREEADMRVKGDREKAEKRLGDLQDKKRQERAKKLANQLGEINKEWTDRFAAQLDRFTAIVHKMEQRAALAAANGKDVRVTTAAIQIAKNVIATAQAAVAAQAAKTYVPTTSVLTTTTATSTPQGQEELTKQVKTALQALHQSLFQDLFALRDGPMTQARRAVQDAFQTLSKVPGVDEDKATSTPSSH